MSTLYRLDVFNDGTVSTLMRTGTPITVDGTPMVRMDHGVIVEAKDWHADVSAAKRVAADQLERIGRKFLDHAAFLRGEVTA